MSADPRTNGELQQGSLPAAGPVRVLAAQRRLLPAVLLSNGLVAAGGGFLAGVVALATLRVLRARRHVHRRRRRAGKDVLTRSVVAKRSFLVDVHLLGK